MIKGDFDYLKKLSQYNVCSEHHAPLVVAWHAVESCWTLRCGEGHYPDAITKQPSLTELWKQGEELPSYIEDNIKGSLRRKAMTQGNKSTSIRNWLVPTSDLGTGEVLPPAIIQALVDYAHRYKLDPERSHVVIMYGKPYITIDGYLYHAKRSGISYSLESRPMSTEEAANYKIKETDYAWLAQLTFIDTSQIFTGLGIVTYDEMTEPSKKNLDQLRSPVVAKHPWQLCQKRSEWQVLRRAFPIGGDE